MVEITLANDKKVTVYMQEFNRDAGRSEKMIARDHNGEEIFPDTIKRVKHFVFETEEY